MREFSEMLGAWDSFYVMIGSSSAALTGLMFVVITLVFDKRQSQTRAGVSIFSTPTVFHFCGVLFTAAFMSAPFHTLVPIAVLLGCVGMGGACYVATVALRGMKLASYQLDAEDLTWHVKLPLAGYLMFVAGAFALRGNAALALYAPAAAVTLLIFVGIHNAWDVVTYLAVGNAPPSFEPPADVAPAEAPS